LEKAWAKVHEAYDLINGGWGKCTVRDLTGAPAYDYSIDEYTDD